MNDGWKWKNGKVEGKISLELDLTGLTRVCCYRTDCNGNSEGVCQRKVIRIGNDMVCGDFDVDD
jgi:hypothetical protein